LLTTRDAEEAEELVGRLKELNNQRKERTQEILAEASVEAELQHSTGRRVLVLAGKRWGKGLVGPAATRIAEHFRRPAILLAYDPEHDHYSGSGRTWGDYNLLRGLQSCEELLGRYGGHHSSAGVTVSADNLEAFRDRIHAVAEGEVPDVPEPPRLVVDAEIASGRAVTVSLVDAVARLEPYGRGNEEPFFLTRGAVLLESKRVGRDNNTASFQFRLPGTPGAVKGIRFKSGDWAEKHPAGTRLDLVYRVKANHFRGNTTVDLQIEDWRPAGA
ncbi:MAG: DHHA1 domain-containing protein, partial [Armatimonadota bacterium]